MAGMLGRKDDAVTLGKCSNTITDSTDMADAAIAWHKRKLWPGTRRIGQPPMDAGVDRQLRTRANRTGLCRDQDLTRAWGGKLSLFGRDLIRGGHHNQTA